MWFSGEQCRGGKWRFINFWTTWTTWTTWAGWAQHWGSWWGTSGTFIKPIKGTVNVILSDSIYWVASTIYNSTLKKLKWIIFLGGFSASENIAKTSSSKVYNKPLCIGHFSILLKFYLNYKYRSTENKIYL